MPISSRVARGSRSQMQSLTALLQECYCCRESFLRERVVSLTHCYDPDGARLSAEGRHSMEVKLREPADCRCFKCGDYSR